MQNLENLDVFEILIAQKLPKGPKDHFVRSALIYNYGVFLMFKLILKKSKVPLGVVIIEYSPTFSYHLRRLD